MANEEWLITAPVEPGDISPNGSVVRWCSLCACEIWLSPAAIVKLDRHHQLKPICINCGVPLMAAHDEVHASAVEPNSPSNAVVIPAMQRAIREAREERKRK